MTSYIFGLHALAMLYLQSRLAGRKGVGCE